MESNATTHPRTPSFQQRAEDDDEIDLLKLWRTIWQRKWSIISLTFIVMMVSVLVVLSLTPIYRAASTLLIEQKQAKIGSIEQIYGLEGGSNEFCKPSLSCSKRAHWPSVWCAS